MRIALVSQEYPPETAAGGIGTQTHAKAHGLAARGHQVHVISHSVNGQRLDAVADGVHVHRVPGYDERMAIVSEAARWITWSGEVAAAIAEVHRRHPLDLVDVPEWGGEGFVHLLNRAEWSSIPTVVHLHGPLAMLADTIGWPAKDSELFRIGSMMEGTCLRLADAVMSSSVCSLEWCARHYVLDPSRVPVIHLGVDTEKFHPDSEARPLRPTIVFAGRIATSKGVDVLVEAVCRLSREIPDLQLRLVGRGDTRTIEALRASAAAYGRDDLLEFVGFVAREQLPYELVRAHVFAAPSLYEGGPGFVYLEAMACGLPVIACSGSGAAEVVVPGQSGVLVRPGDSEALSGAFRTMFADDVARERLGARARDYVVRHADRQPCLDRLEEFYRKVSGADWSASCEQRALP